MKDRKITELPFATKLPGDNEYVLPICIDNTTSVVHSISIKALADRITELTLRGNEIEMITTEHGIKFKKIGGPTNMRKGDVEFRWSDCNNAHELVRWQGDTCYTIAFFREHKEGYDMRTVGDRFFQDHDLWIVPKHAITFLEDCFKEDRT